MGESSETGHRGGLKFKGLCKGGGNRLEGKGVNEKTREL